MKKSIIDYYDIIMLVLYLVYNIGLISLKIGGVLYQIIMVIIIIVNAIILIVFRKKIKYKEAVCTIYFFAWLFSKNIFQCFFGISNILVFLCISSCLKGLFENNFIKIFALFILTVVLVYVLPFLFIFLLCFGPSIDDEIGRSDIYEDKHYYCKNNYEVYSYSAGAMDKFHYSIGKHYEILDIDDIIYISYSERNEVEDIDYYDYLNSHDCKLVGDVNGSK